MHPYIRHAVYVVAIVVTAGLLLAWKCGALDIFWMKVLLCAWAVAPPFWFLLDWHLFEYETTEQFEEFKHSQELARNLWAGVIVLLAVVTGISVSATH